MSRKSRIGDFKISKTRLYMKSIVCDDNTLEDVACTEQINQYYFICQLEISEQNSKLNIFKVKKLRKFDTNTAIVIPEESS